MILLALLLQTATAQEPPEIIVPAPARPSAQTPATIVVEPVAMFVAACDADGDGLTERYELTPCVQRSFEAIDTAKTGKLRYFAFADWALRYLGDRNALPSPFDVDKDGDNMVSLDELQAQFQKLGIDVTLQQSPLTYSAAMLGQRFECDRAVLAFGDDAQVRPGAAQGIDQGLAQQRFVFGDHDTGRHRVHPFGQRAGAGRGRQQRIPRRQGPNPGARRAGQELSSSRSSRSSWAFSSTTKSSRPASRSFMAIPMPENPVPMTMMSLVITVRILSVSEYHAKVCQATPGLAEEGQR
jgi:hypothetical protein